MDQDSIPLMDQIELMEGLSALQMDECSTAKTPTIPQNLCENSSERRAPGAQLTSHFYNSDAISSKGGPTDQTLQDSTLLVADEIDKTSVTSYSYIPAVITTEADAVDPYPQDRALLNAGKSDAISANNAVSPFLSLPQEVKDRIYELVCGENVIHIHYNDNKLSHHICQAVVGEDDAHDIIDNTQNPESATKTWEYVIRKGDRDWFTHRPLARRSMDLRFLRTCKQIHWEAKAIPFTSNTFSFTRPHTLHPFLTRNPNGARVRNAALIHKVHLKIRICYAYEKQIWFENLTTIALQLKSIQQLCIDIGFRSYAVFSLKRCYVVDPFQKQFMEDLIQLRLPQLRTVTLILSSGAESKARPATPARSTRNSGLYRPVIDQKQDWIESIKDVLRPKSRDRDSLDGHFAI